MKPIGTRDLWRRSTPRVSAAMGSFVSPATLTKAFVVALMLLPVIAMASYQSVSVWAIGPVEMPIFGPAGAALLTGHWTAVYANADMQAGPLELISFGIASLLKVHGTAQWVALYTACTFVLTVGYLLAALAPVVRSVRRAHLTVAGIAGVAVCFTGFLSWAFDSGHPAQMVIPGLWVMAACAARDSRCATAGVLVGLSTGWESWGLLGAPVIFCAARPDLVRAALAGLTTLTVLYGPFVLTAHFRMFDYVWPVSDGSLVHLLRPDLDVFPWSLRLLQAIVVLAAGVGIAYGTRRSIQCLWIVPMLILVMRLLLDPMTSGYYWIAPGSLMFAAAALAIQRARPMPLVVTVLLAGWLSVPWSHTLLGAGILVVVVGICAPVAIAVDQGRRRSGGHALGQHPIDEKLFVHKAF